MKRTDRRAKVIGNRIHAARVSRNLNLSQVATAAEVDTSQLWRLERGIGRTSFETYERIGAVVGLSLADMLAPETVRAA